MRGAGDKELSAMTIYDAQRVGDVRAHRMRRQWLPRPRGESYRLRDSARGAALVGDCGEKSRRPRKTWLRPISDDSPP